MLEFQTTQPEETITIAKKLGRQLQAGDVLLLDGDLGAGKTTFTKGLAEGLDIKRYIKSPTFTLIREYPDGRIPLYHMDVYRLEETGASDLGLEEYFDGDGVSVIEWSQFIADELPSDYLTIHFNKNDDDDQMRTLVFEPHGARYTALIAASFDN
ncbi:tRNA (adenosine(37)-N6)-threonylcarbamoyltransferase complex ATPase subunit type 1 TsaE [Latilactobacillus sakei]|nr:tRNA (adenosine(37)-N6)-threonylcarbamoyltransferase complex ATPase subunit type 1 TsaE [Latilactobacillus sakei]AUX12252.1 tRNA (adenosine(37)-N6)-threonylcarbamoyltransferase complex ATPase subunit type 1 TsaE [Latilactobacillus sakei]